MIIINLIIGKSRLCYKITIKYSQNVPYSQFYYNKTQIKTSTKKFAYFTHPNFSKAKIEKRVQITRANTVHLSVNTVVCFVMGENGGSELSIRFKCMSQKDLVGKKKVKVSRNRRRLPKWFLKAPDFLDVSPLQGW